MGARGGGVRDINTFAFTSSVSYVRIIILFVVVVVCCEFWFLFKNNFKKQETVGRKN